MSGPSPALLAWYDQHRRDLPWRADIDPYRVLVSEVMLQQTQVGRVIERYEQFLDRFPTIDSLDAASLAEVVSEWSGLGYNRRARNLHRTARIVVTEGWPTTAEGLLRLPGVGRYTASAVAAICFGEPLPAVDTNLRRVLSRWHGAPLSDLEAAAVAGSLIDHRRPGEWNQALMDLGAAHCTPRQPRCGGCPVEAWCSDADVYVMPPAQGRFEGSSRQARGAVVRLLVDASLTADDLVDRSGLARDRIVAACHALDREGLVTSDGSGVYSLAE